MLAHLTHSIATLTRMLIVVCQVKGTANEFEDDQVSDTAHSISKSEWMILLNENSEFLMEFESSIDTQLLSPLGPINIENIKSSSRNTPSVCGSVPSNYELNDSNSHNAKTNGCVSYRLERNPNIRQKLYQIAHSITQEVYKLLKSEIIKGTKGVDRFEIKDIYHFVENAESKPLVMLDKLDIPGFILSLMNEPIPEYGKFLQLLNEWIPYSSARRYSPKIFKDMKVPSTDLFYVPLTKILMIVICKPFLVSHTDKRTNITTNFVDLKRFYHLKNLGIQHALKYLMENPTFQTGGYIFEMLGFYSDFGKIYEMLLLFIEEMRIVVVDFPYAIEIIEHHIIDPISNMILDAYPNIGSHYNHIKDFIEAVNIEQRIYIDESVLISTARLYILGIGREFTMEIIRDSILYKLFDVPNGNIILDICKKCQNGILNPGLHSSNSRNILFESFAQTALAIENSKELKGIRSALFHVLKSENVINLWRNLDSMFKSVDYRYEPESYSGEESLWLLVNRYHENGRDMRILERIYPGISYNAIWPYLREAAV